MTDDADAIARLERARPRGGKVDLGSGKAQHVDLFRKLNLRRELLALADPGAAWVPFLGEADIALELYADREVYGVELDARIAEHAADRLLAARPHGPPIFVLAGDAERWTKPGPAIDQPFAVLDVDAFSNPYRALENAWHVLTEPDHPAIGTGLARRVAVFGTDGMRLAIRQSKTRFYPSPTSRKLSSGSISDKRRQWNNWWGGFIRPWLEELVAPSTIVAERKYLREHMLYWGVVVDRAAGSGPVAPGEGSSPHDAGAPLDSARKPDPPPSPVGIPGNGYADAGAPADIAKVEKALLEAAESGNVAAAIFWLEHKGGPTWSKPTPASTSGARELLDDMLRPPKRPTRRKT